METVEDLVAAAQAGNEESYDRIYERFQRMAMSYAYSILGDYELAEDAKQEAFIAAYCDLQSLKNQSAFPGWFRTIIRRHSITIMRRRQELLVPLESVAEQKSAAPPPSAVAESKEMRGQIQYAIEQLPEKECVVTRMYFLENRSLKEISSLAGISTTTVKSRLHSARGRLRHRLVGMVKDIITGQHAADDQRMRRAATKEAVVQIDRELGHLKQEREAGIQRMAELLCAKGRLLRFMGQMEVAFETFSVGLNADEFLEHPALRNRFRVELGLTSAQVSDYARARKELESARRSIGKEGGDSILQGLILNGLGTCAWGEGDFKKARRIYQQTLESSREANIAELEAVALNNLALLDWKSGSLQKSLENFQACLKCWKKLRNRFGWSLSLMNVGIIEENMGRFAPAARHYKEALAVAQDVNFVQVQVACNNNLGNLALNQRQWERALELNADALELSRTINDRRSEAISHENQALAYIGLKQYEQAEQALQQAMPIATEIGDEERLFSLALVDIELQLAQKESEGVLRKFEQLEQTAKARDYSSERPRLLRLRAAAEFLSGDEQAGRKTIDRAIREAQKQQNRPEQKKLILMRKQVKKGPRRGTG